VCYLGISKAVYKVEMESLVKHIVHITGNRDHATLDLSVVAAVQELSGAIQTQVMSVVLEHGHLYFRLRASIDVNGMAYVENVDDSAALNVPFQPPQRVASCLAARGCSITTDDGPERSILWLPIWSGDAADTCLAVVHTPPLAGNLAQVVEGIVAIYRNFQTLLQYSERDSLTNLLNRKTFDDHLAKMLRASREPVVMHHVLERRVVNNDEKAWLAVADVDYFKTVNDTFGHLYGDEVLILMANLLRSSFRTTDRIFRFGGEEFVILLRPTSIANALQVIERFRCNVEAYVFPQVGRITVSVGFVAIDPNQSPVATLGFADQALYYVKTHGRNQVCSYDALVELGHLQPPTSNSSVDLF
jgi:diguanylate cyclase (GGDEF)-like protein